MVWLISNKHKKRGFYLICLLSFFWISVCWAEGPIKIAAIFPQIGKAKAYGLDSIKGARLAIKEINQDGGLMGAPLELIILDNKSSPFYAKQAARQAIALKVSAVVGCSWSTQSLAMAPVLQEAGIPMISPSATAPKVTHVGSYIFRACYTDTFQGRLMAGFAHKELNARTAAVMINLNETYSQALAQTFIAFFEKNGGKILFSNGYKGSAIDFKKNLKVVKSKSPDVVFIPGYSRDSGLIIRQARAMGISAIFIGGDAWEKNIANFAGPGLEGSYFSTFWHPRVSSRESLNFTNIYYHTYGDREISPYAAQGYDAIHLVAHAIKTSGKNDADAIRQALQETNGFKGVTGRYFFNEFGDPTSKGAAILKFTMGKWLFYKWIDPTAGTTSNKNEKNNTPLEN